MELLEDRLRRGGRDAICFVEEFLFGDDRITRTLQRLDEQFAAAQIRYAVTGDLACIVHGHVRTTCELEVLVDPDDQTRLPMLAASAYSFVSTSRSLRDRQTDVSIRWSARSAHCVVEIDGVIYVGLAELIESKLQPFIDGDRRIKGLADVIALVRARQLPLDFANQLRQSCRSKYTELWHDAQLSPELPSPQGE